MRVVVWERKYSVIYIDAQIFPIAYARPRISNLDLHGIRLQA